MQPNQTPRHTVIDGEKWSYEQPGVKGGGQATWAIGNSLDVLIRDNHVDYIVRAPDMYALTLPNPKAGVKGNVMISGLTVVRRQPGGGIEQETATWQEPRENTIEPMTMEGLSGTAHSEFQFFLGWTEAALANLVLDSTLTVIFEAHQTNTPCASCQKLIGMHLLNIEERTGKSALFRGRARQLYESAPGCLGTALHQVTLGTRQLDGQGPAHVKDIIGLHLTL